MSSQDRIQLGLSDAARDAADDVVEKGGFKQRQDVYRLAIAAALRKGLDPVDEGRSRENYINVGGMDQDGSIRTAIVQLRDAEERPYALAERLAEAGIEDIHAHLLAGRSLREYLQALTAAS